MAIDSRVKRASVLTFAQPFAWSDHLPDGTISAGDRAYLQNLYAGITLKLPADLSTPDRRKSALQLFQPWMWTPPTADGTISATDRAWLSHLYSGYVYTPAPPPSFINTPDKRASALQFQQQWVWIGFARDGTIGSGDREQLQKLYRMPLDSGIASSVNTPQKRASVLQFMQPWVWSWGPAAADGAIGASDRAHFSHLYAGLSLSTGGYTAGSATLRAGVFASDVDAQNIQYAANTFSPLRLNVLQIAGAGSFTPPIDATAGAGSLIAGIRLTGQGSYVGGSQGSSSGFIIPVSLTSSGTFTPSSDTVFGSTLAIAGISVSGVGHYAAPITQTGDIFSHFMLCNQLTFEETICAIYKSIGQQGAGGTVMGLGGGRAPYFDERSYEKMQELLEFLKRWKPEPSTDRTLERVIERQPIYIQSDGKQPTVIERVIKPAVVVAGPNDDEEAIVHALMMELASDD